MLMILLKRVFFELSNFSSGENSEQLFQYAEISCKMDPGSLNLISYLNLSA